MSILKNFSRVLAILNPITLLKKLYKFIIYVKIMAKKNFLEIKSIWKLFGK